MLHRDVMAGPNNDHTKFENPGPGAYKEKRGFLKVSDHDLGVTASGFSASGNPIQVSAF
jgi:hypothetical protein